MKNRTGQQKALEELYDTYEFEQREFDEFTVSVYREENKSLAREKDFRIIIIFRGETTPYAVITNDHDNITAPKIRSVEGDAPFRDFLFLQTAQPAARAL
ncbi:MAG: hypothetical protein U5L96_19410 [Owenweeksia sp.]|nr:hypothetical protein [Owenweeksia sp.]